jgi:hypothetical protein
MLAKKTCIYIYIIIIIMILYIFLDELTISHANESERKTEFNCLIIGLENQSKLLHHHEI